MADHTPAYVATLAGQLQARHPDLLARAENDLAIYRARLALVARWINNPANDRDACSSLAQTLGLPEPSQEKPHG
jgi:hypothetical protein